MKRILFVFLMILCTGASFAACPSGWEEVPMENIEFTSAASCPADTETYYTVDSMCDANVL